MKVTVLRSEKNVCGSLHRQNHPRSQEGAFCVLFPICGRCAVQRDCKLKPILRYQKSLPPDTVQYIGIAKDEHRNGCFDGRKPGLLTGQVQLYRGRCKAALPAGRAAFACLHIYNPRGCWFCPNANEKNCAISMITTRTCGNGCWSCRPYPTR